MIYLPLMGRPLLIVHKSGVLPILIPNLFMRIGTVMGNCTAGVGIIRSSRQYSEIEIVFRSIFWTEYLASINALGLLLQIVIVSYHAPQQRVELAILLCHAIDLGHKKSHLLFVGFHVMCVVEASKSPTSVLGTP